MRNAWRKACEYYARDVQSWLTADFKGNHITRLALSDSANPLGFLIHQEE
jgi:hypothetical protein